MEKDIVPELLEKIQKEFQENFNKSEKIKALEAKVRDGTATYIEAQEYALETGDILAQAFRKHITADDLPDGRMYYNIAQRILQPTLGENHKIITDITTQVQNALNKKAGLGIKAVVPEFNQERVEGLVNHLNHAESFEEVARTLDEPIKQHAMSVVSDAIEANARFQYDAGLQPKIVREAEHKCCEWCSRLEGSFRYPNEVPADVYRRHDRCRCTVNYVVGKKRQDVHHGNRGQKRRYVKDEYDTYVLSKDARIKRAKEMEVIENERKNADKEKRKTIGGNTTKGQDITRYYYGSATPGKGNILYEDGYDEDLHREEIEMAKFLHSVFGGSIKLLNEVNEDGIKTPDYLWSGKLWDLKTVTTEKSADSAIRKGLKQIKKNPGGIVLDYRGKDIDLDSLIRVIESRMRWGYEDNTDIMVVLNENNVKVYNYKK